MTGALSPHHRLRQMFDRFADADGPAYHHGDGDLSFKNLFRAAAALAAELAEGGDTPVLIHGHKNRRFIIAYWAALLSGRTAAPVEPDIAIDRIDHIAGISGAGEILLTEDGAIPDFSASLHVRRVRESANETAQHTFNTLPVPGEERRRAYILFSSGTTGQPKGIGVSYVNLVDFIDWLQTLFVGFGPVGCVSGNVRYCFDVSLFEMWTSWLSLRPVSAFDHRDVINTGKQIARYGDHGLTHWVSTPALASYWLKNKRFNADSLPEMRVMLFCGEVLSKSLVEALWRRFPKVRILNTYGPTECTVAVTSVEITRDHLTQEGPLPIGVPRAGTALALASHGAGSGELVISGNSVGPGYLGDAERQMSRFPVCGAYLTGDWGHQRPDGNWCFEGRMDREIKLNGYRIDLNAVEMAIRDCPKAEDVVVDVHPAGRALQAFVLGCSRSAEFSVIARALEKRLPSYMAPRFWYGAAEFSFNANSKLDRNRFISELSAADKPYIHTPETLFSPAAAE